MGGRQVVRAAVVRDVPMIEAVVRAAYTPYIERIGKLPGPMLDDYPARVRDGSVSILEVDGQVVGVLVLVPEPDHVLLYNVAVAPAVQGRGLGRRLVEHAENEARRLSLAEVRLFTHVLMHENIALYRRAGYAETHRVEEAGYARVYMRKRI